MSLIKTVELPSFALVWTTLHGSHAITTYRTLVFCSCLSCYPRILEQERDCSQSMSSTNKLPCNVREQLLVYRLNPFESPN